MSVKHECDYLCQYSKVLLSIARPGPVVEGVVPVRLDRSFPDRRPTVSTVEPPRERTRSGTPIGTDKTLKMVWYD
ncbi:hypothetical protein NJ7G_1905 [Natrinema sp. J7-2]|nr:hypothetical protein NJ7G_1905 [Natrinema sp. J7-2]